MILEQYTAGKAQAPEALLLFRMGDFYELFYDDAKVAARVLGLCLTVRAKDNPIPMTGFPYHQLDAYVAKLVASGLRVAILEN